MGTWFITLRSLSRLLRVEINLEHDEYLLSFILALSNLEIDFLFTFNINVTLNL